MTDREQEGNELVGKGMVDCHCADCGNEVVPGVGYVIVPPFDRREKHDGREAYMMCVTCWDRIIGLAFMSAIR